MKIAVSSANGNQISGHADRCATYLMYELTPNQTVRQSRVTLDPTQLLSHLEDRLSAHPEHPLHGIDAFITQSLAQTLNQHLIKDGIQVVQTQEQTPLHVINSLALTLK